jgi:hypothetical protein
LNENLSCVGVDLGEGRKLLPTCYSVRNRNSLSHILMNWHFEGSNDKTTWCILDRRIYLSDSMEYNMEVEEEHRALNQKGKINTWGVDPQVFQEVGNHGFRYFRLVQVGKNSSGSEHLSLSGLELYGKATSGTWP